MLTKQADFHSHCFVLCIRATENSISSFPVSDTEPVAGVGAATGPDALSSYPEAFSSLSLLNSIEQGLEGLDQTPAACSDLCLSGTVKVTAFFFQIL